MRKGGYTLTLKNEGSTPHTFQIYQIFSGDLDESKTLSNIQWGTGIKEASKETLGTAAEKAQTLTGESEAKEFAKTIQEHLNEDNKLEVRVEKNDSTTVANLNAGYYLIKDKEGSQTQTPPNSAYSLISGHRGVPSAKLFTDIDKLKKGDLFFIHVFDEVLAYKVNQIKIVLPDDVETLEIEKGKDYVTLITCTPYGVNSHRLLVRGERTVYKQSESKIEDMIKKNNLKYIMLTAGVILALIGMTVLVSVFLIKRRKRRKLNEK